MRVLVACEESQVVTKAFRALGHEAYSCDIQDCSGGHPEWHIKGDALEQAYSGRYDLMIGHPPCTYLSKVGVQHNKKPGRLELREAAIEFFLQLKNAPIEMICLENPIPQVYVMNKIGWYNQRIQPYYFGDPYIKTTCLWLRGLPKLSGLIEVAANEKKYKPKPDGFNGRGNPYYFHDSVTGKDRAKIRSKTFPGIAKAMAEQWSEYILNKQLKVA